MSRLHRTRRVLGLLTAAAGGLLVLVMVGGVLVPRDSLSGRVIGPPGGATPWVRISPQQVLSGVTIPSNSNVMFQLPDGFERITREALLGGKGKVARYWGYCLPENYDPKLTSRTQGLPGKLFLSEKEREVQRARAAQLRPTPSIYSPLVEEEEPEPTLKHQVEIFLPNILCYIMTDTPLAMGLDADGDFINSRVERDINTDPANPDTDADGISDGVEYLHGINPLQRDMDGDGLIDGLEDLDHDGRIDVEDTDPRTRDTDRDGLCDGICLVSLATGQYLYLGEDMNLSGSVDKGESDPKTPFTKGTTNDYNSYFLCKEGSTSYCFP